MRCMRCKEGWVEKEGIFQSWSELGNLRIWIKWHTMDSNGTMGGVYSYFDMRKVDLIILARLWIFFT